MNPVISRREVKIILIAILLLVALRLILHAWVGDNHESTNNLGLTKTTIVTHDKTITLMLETADTLAKRELGLMHRKTLAPHDGMAFFFPTTAPQKFWMKNTLIPLDMLFVDEAGKIVYILTATPLSDEPVGPEMPVRSVIEVAGNRSKALGIRVGDRVSYEKFSSNLP